MIAYKLFRQRKDGTLGPLFINRKQIVKTGVEYQAELHPTNGFKVRHGWHCCAEKSAPHLSKKGRVWAKVEIHDYVEHNRPIAQGGLWYTANRMRIIEILP